MGDLEERETISSRSRPAARSVTPAPIIEDHAQRSRIPIATASSETEVAGEASMATDKLWSKKCSPSSSAGPPNWRIPVSEFGPRRPALILLGRDAVP